MNKKGSLSYVVGVDFDNTLVSYHHLFYREAIRRRWVSRSLVSRDKRSIRDVLCRLPKGEQKWQRLQSVVYGQKMTKARLFPGVRTFFRLCRGHRVPVYIVSHKTLYSHPGNPKVDLRETATRWMKNRHFFEPGGLGLTPEAVFFEPTRRKKIERIRRLKCTHFVDDLEETFGEEFFPAGVRKILYAPQGGVRRLPGVKTFTQWKEINDHFFGP